MKPDVFVPPGVQANLFRRLGYCPRQLRPAAKRKIEALWIERNQAPEMEIQSIDEKIESIAVNDVMAERATKGARSV